MQYFCFGKKIGLWLVFICLVQLGFARTVVPVLKPLDGKQIACQTESQQPQRSGLQAGDLESSIQLKHLKYVPLTKIIYEETKRHHKLLLPGVVVDDVIVMLHDAPHSLYTKTSPPGLERSPG